MRRRQGAWATGEYGWCSSPIATPARLRLRLSSATAFDDADRVVLMDVYSAGETPIPGVTGKTVVESILRHNGRGASNVVAAPRRGRGLPHESAAVGRPRPHDGGRGRDRDGPGDREGPVGPLG